MTPNEFQQLALRTENTPAFLGGNRQLERIFHGAIGLATETGELQDALKKHIFYGKPLDVLNVAEEAQDCAWYIAVILDACGMTFEQAMERNIAKLRARYGERYSDQAALHRDLDAERKALEGR